MFYFHVLKTLILLSLCFYMETLNFMYIHNKESKLFKVKYIKKTKKNPTFCCNLNFDRNLFLGEK